MNSTPTPTPARPSRWKAVLLLTLVFILGAGCGIGGGLLMLRRAVQRAIAHPNGDQAPIELVLGKIESRISSELDLTKTERAAVHAELRQTAAEFKALRNEVWSKAALNAQATLDRLAKHLPPEKAARLRSEAERRLKPWGLIIEK